MKSLLASTVLILLMIPALAAADGNANPHLYLEIYDFVSDPVSVPDYVCSCQIVYPQTIQCFSAKSSGTAFGVVPVHVGKVENGFHGLVFGVAASGGDAIFLGAAACPGFVKGQSSAGEPQAIFISTAGPCHQWRDHTGYLKYLALDTDATYFDIVPSADTGHNKVINCDDQYDEGTVVGGRSQWGGTQDITCQGDPTYLRLQTWGKIKDLFR
jgi:hypothetical protein